MRLMYSKEDMIDRIKNSVNYAVRSHTNIHSGNIRLDGPFMGMLEYIITNAVTAGFNQMLNDVYTDDEFERDLTLKS